MDDNFRKSISVNDDPLSIETTNDAFLEGRIMVRQPVKGARAAIDSLFLAAAVPADRDTDESLFDAGTGSGIVSLALAARLPFAKITAIDVEPVMCALASENAVRNGFSDRITIFEGDVTQQLSHNERLNRLAGSCDHVLANPPFYLEGEGRPSPDALKMRAHRTKPGALQDWIRFLTAMTAPHGSLTLIHSTAFLTEILSALHGRFGAITLFPLFPRAGSAAKRLIISGVKGSKAPHRLLPGIYLHLEDGRYTSEAEAVLRRGEPLQLGITPKSRTQKCDE